MAGRMTRFAARKPSPFSGAGTGLSPSLRGKGGQTKDNGLPHGGEHCEKAGFIPSLVFSGSMF